MTDSPWLRSASRPFVAAGLHITDARGYVLLVEPTYKDSWEVPGGVVETGESPAAGCQREVAEELGLDERRLPVGRLLCIDWGDDEGDGAPHPSGASTLRLQYEARGTVSLEEVALLPDELRSAAYVAPEDVGRFCRPGLARRIQAAVWAARTGGVAELERGLRRGGPSAEGS